jgi:hypothetical protein
MRKTAFAWNAIGFVLVNLAIATIASNAADVHSGDDGWRRTTQGWERADGLSALGSAPVQQRFVFSEGRRQAKTRWDIHPGLLVAVELFLVTGAFLAWPRPQGMAPANQWQRERR